MILLSVLRISRLGAKLQVPFNLRPTQIYHQHPSGRHPLKILKCWKLHGQGTIKWLLVLKWHIPDLLAAVKIPCAKDRNLRVWWPVKCHIVNHTFIFMIWKMLSLVRRETSMLYANRQVHQSKPRASARAEQTSTSVTNTSKRGLSTHTLANINWLEG